jgi:hypothetical protein
LLNSRWLVAPLVIAAVGCAHRRALPPLEPAPAAEPAAFPAWPEPFDAPKSPELARAARLALRRLAPDHRFVAAFDALASLTGRSSAPARVQRHGERWLVVEDQRVVASAGDFADFEVWFDALALHAERAAFIPRTTESPVPAVYLVGDALDAELGALNAAWSRPGTDAGVLARAARATLASAFTTADLLELNDDGWSQAIGASALAHAAGLLAPSDLALLAWGLGYVKSAQARCAKAPVTDAICAFVRGDETQLDALAHRPGAQPFERYLLTRQLALKRRFQLTEKAIEAGGAEQLTRPFLLAWLSPKDFDVSGKYGAPALMTVLADALARAGLKGSLDERLAGMGERPSLFGVVEPALASLPDGPVFGARQQRALVLAQLATALDAMLGFSLGQARNGAFGRKFVESLGDASEPTLRDVHAYLKVRALPFRATGVDEKELRDSQQAFEEALETGFAHLNGRPVSALADERAGTMPIQPATHHFVRLAARRLDGRPAHRVELLRIIRARSPDMIWLEQAGAAVSAVEDGDVTRDWFETRDQGSGATDRFAKDARRPAWARAGSVEQLNAEGKLTADERVARLKALAEAFPEDDEVFRLYRNVLDRERRWAEGAALLGPWVQKNADEHSIRAANNRVMLARALWSLGRLDEADAVVRPATEFGTLDGLLQPALIALARGDKARALELERQTIKSYPEGGRHVVEVLWRAGEYATACERLRDNMPLGDFERLAQVVVLAFDGRPAAELTRAMECFHSVGIPRRLEQVARGLVEARRVDLAATVMALAPPPENGRGAARTFVLYRQLRGPEAASAWLAARPGVASMFFESAFDQRIDEVFVEPPAQLAAALDTEQNAFAQALVLSRRGVARGPVFEAARARAAAHREPRWLPVQVVLGLAPVAQLNQSAPDSIAAALARAAVLEQKRQFREAIELYLDRVDGMRRYDRATLYGDWPFRRLDALLKTGKSVRRLEAEGP